MRSARRTAKNCKKKENTQHHRIPTTLDSLTHTGVGLYQVTKMPSNGEHIPVRRHSINQLDTYDVSADELDRIEAECMDVGQDFQFASVALGIGVSFLIALIFTTVTSPIIFACFFAVVLTMFVLSAYFWIRYFRKKPTIQTTVQRIKERQVGPVGEEGRELSPKVLANLPVAQVELPKAPTDVVIVEADGVTGAPQPAALGEEK